MKVLSLKAENILSLKEIRISMHDSGLMLVEGWNYDDGRANGAGKTAIFNALSFAIYGKLPRKITISEILRKGTKKGYAEAEVLTTDGVYTVRRERPKAVSFKKDGVPITMTQEEFEHKIKLSYDQFLISMYTAQQSQNKFLTLNDSQKKDFLLQLMNLHEFAMCKKEAETEIKSLDQQISDENIKMEKAKSKIDAYKESIDIEYSKDVIDQMESEIAKLTVEVKELELIPEPKISRYIKLECEIQRKLEKLTGIRYIRNKEHNELDKLSSLIHPFVATAPDAECPHCNGELMVHGRSVSKPSDTAVHRANHEAKMSEYKEQIRAKKSIIDSYDVRLVQESQLRNLLNKSREKKDRESASYYKIQNRLSNVLVSIDKKQTTIQQTNLKIEKVNELRRKTDILKQYIVKAVSVIDEHNSNKELYKAVSAMYAPTGAPAYIMDSIVDTFNEIVSEHISLVWPNATYSLQSYRENKSGDVTAKFSESLVINGNARSIGSLSGGEQRALSLSVDFTVVDILSQQFGIPLNPIIMDEPFEGLDATGREIVIELLNKLSMKRQIWVIDHASEAKSMFSHIVRIEKRNGISSVVSDLLV